MDGDPDCYQNLINRSLGHAPPLLKISSKSVHNTSCSVADRQTYKQTQVKNITSFLRGGNYND